MDDSVCTCSSRAASKEKIWSKIKHVSVVYCLCLVPEEGRQGTSLVIERSWERSGKI